MGDAACLPARPATTGDNITRPVFDGRIKSLADDNFKLMKMAEFFTKKFKKNTVGKNKLLKLAITPFPIVF